MEKANWEHTTVLKELDTEEILRIKQEPGENIMIFGSGTLVEQLTNLGQLDEYHLMVNPVILGQGLPLFKNIRDRMNLKLFNTRTFRSGIVLLQYESDK